MNDNAPIHEAMIAIRDLNNLFFVVAAHRSLNMDFENQDKEKDSSSSAGPFNGNSTNNSKSKRNIWLVKTAWDSLILQPCDD